MKKTALSLLCCLLFLCLSSSIYAQENAHNTAANDSTPKSYTLKDCIDYALRNQPAVNQAAIDEQINERNVRIGLSDWLPQVNSADTYDRYFKGTPLTLPAGSGNVDNLSTLGVQASQVIYNNDVLLASRGAKYSRQYYKQNTLSTKITVVSDVSKAFFDVLLSEKQLDILNEDITRLQRSLKDAYSRYQAGVTDKTDYKQATISLNNSIAQRKQTMEGIKAKIAYLKQQMGVNPVSDLKLVYDSTRYEQEANIDTNQILDVNNRIEYRLLQTQKNIDNLNVSYYKWGFLPSLSAVGQYNWYYFSDRFSTLYNKSYPNAYAGLSLNIPIFTGTKRLQNLSKAKLEVERRDFDIINTRNSINSDYQQALATYKGNYTSWQLLKQNVQLASDVYKVVSLQYREGIKTYLDVIVAQSDLRTAELSYFNSLFEVLSSKIDLEKALGTLPVQ